MQSCSTRGQPVMSFVLCWSCPRRSSPCPEGPIQWHLYVIWNSHYILINFCAVFDMVATTNAVRLHGTVLTYLSITVGSCNWSLNVCFEVAMWAWLLGNQSRDVCTILPLHACRVSSRYSPGKFLFVAVDALSIFNVCPSIFMSVVNKTMSDRVWLSSIVQV